VAWSTNLLPESSDQPFTPPSGSRFTTSFSTKSKCQLIFCALLPNSNEQPSWKINLGTKGDVSIRIRIIFALLAVLFSLQPVVPAAEPKNEILLSVFFRHDQSKTLDEIQEHLKKTGFEKSFPPEGTEIVSWYVMMGIGQVVTLRLPPEKLREVNVSIEKGARGAFRTEFYATYDYMPIREAERKSADSLCR